MSMELSKDQKDAIEQILCFWSGNSRMLTMGGLAGTGKTTTIMEATKALRNKRKSHRRSSVKIAFAAYTGKAAEVLRRKIEKHLQADDVCSTIHSLIYEPKFVDGKLVGFNKKQVLDFDLLVIDEASMVSDDLHQDLLHYRVPILYVGDHGQLPPIQGSLNLMDSPNIKLEHIHRQAEGNPIIRLSLMARECGRIPVGEYGEFVRKVDDLNVIDRISDPDKAMILCSYNGFRCDMNRKIRGIMGIVGPSPIVGDRVICLRNNKDRGIYNGMTGTIMSIEESTANAYLADIDMDGSGNFSGLISTHQFGAEKTVIKVLGWTKERPIELFDFGYAMTVWKAQGSEADRVVFFEQRSQYMDDDQWRRLLYTGITRAKERLLIVGF